MAWLYWSQTGDRKGEKNGPSQARVVARRLDASSAGRAGVGAGTTGPTLRMRVAAPSGGSPTGSGPGLSLLPHNP